MPELEKYDYRGNPDFCGLGLIFFAKLPVGSSNRGCLAAAPNHACSTIATEAKGGRSESALHDLGFCVSIRFVFAIATGQPLD